jgi:hypothetical protein
MSQQIDPEAESGPPRRPLDFWLMLVDGLLNRRFRDVLDEHGLTRREWEILRMLDAGAAGVEELDADLRPFFDAGDGPGVVDSLTELAESGWVGFEGSGFALTDRGRTSVARLSEVLDRNRRSITSGISPERWATLLEVLEQVAHNLGWNEDLARTIEGTGPSAADEPSLPARST